MMVMQQEKLLEEISILLLRSGYTIKRLKRRCLDIIARKDDRILFLKIVEDANSLSAESLNELKMIASYISAQPMIIANKAAEKLADGVVYARAGTPTLNKNTFQDSLDNNFPFVQKTNAGMTVEIKGNLLKKKREESGFSLNLLATKLGVSRRMIHNYESGTSRITMQRASRIQDLFGSDLFRRIDIFSAPLSEFSPSANRRFSRIVGKYENLGFSTSNLRKLPVDMISKRNADVILTEVGNEMDKEMVSLSRLADVDNLVIYSKKRPADVPGLTEQEFMDFEKASELIKFLKEFP